MGVGLHRQAGVGWGWLHSGGQEGQKQGPHLVAGLPESCQQCSCRADRGGLTGPYPHPLHPHPYLRPPVLTAETLCDWGSDNLFTTNLGSHVALHGGACIRQRCVHVPHPAGERGTGGVRHNEEYMSSSAMYCSKCIPRRPVTLHVPIPRTQHGTIGHPSGWR